LSSHEPPEHVDDGAALDELRVVRRRRRELRAGDHVVEPERTEPDREIGDAIADRLRSWATPSRLSRIAISDLTTQRERWVLDQLVGARLVEQDSTSRRRRDHLERLERVRRRRLAPQVAMQIHRERAAGPEDLQVIPKGLRRRWQTR
jgi:hypothetical protein